MSKEIEVMRQMAAIMQAELNMHNYSISIKEKEEDIERLKHQGVLQTEVIEKAKSKIVELEASQG
jgi:hypothetical protein